jgi:hypothetical protein
MALSTWRRTAAAALFALQAVIAVSPVLERRDAVRRDAHVEAQGDRHIFAHDESTCATCAARTVVAGAPPQAAALFAGTSSSRVDIAYATVARFTGLAPDNHPRAPPVTG